VRGIDIGNGVCEDGCMTDQDNPLASPNDGVTGGVTSEQRGDWVEGAVPKEETPTLTVPVDRSETAEEAERMAYEEKPARDLEIALKNEKSGENSDLQKENIDAMKKLQEKFKHAFEEKVYPDQRVFVIKDRYIDLPYQRIMFSRNGIFSVSIATAAGAYINPPDDIDQVDFAKVSDFMGETSKDQEDRAGKHYEVPEGFVDGSRLTATSRVYVRRTFVVAEADNVSKGWRRENMLKYLQTVEKQHEMDPLNEQRLQQMGHSLNAFAGSL